MKKRNQQVRQACLPREALHNPMMMACEHCGKRNRYDVPQSLGTTKCKRCGHAAFLPKDKCDEQKCIDKRLFETRAANSITQDESDAMAMLDWH